MMQRRSTKVVAGRVAGRTAKAAPARARSSRAATRVAPGCRICIGRIVRWEQRVPVVDYEGNPAGPVRARVADGGVQRTPDPPAGALQEVVLLVDPKPGRPPVVLGVLRPLDAADQPAAVEARVDGRRVELEGSEEVVLRCGEASITLRRNGRIVIRGLQVETRAAGLNRIRGGSVAIN